MSEWLRKARAAGLGPDDIEAIYRTAFRNCFADGARGGMTSHEPRPRDATDSARSTAGAGRCSDCTLTIPEGKVVGLVGPNGAGKTTLLHLAVGLLAPTAGYDHRARRRSGRRRPAQLGRVGFVAQDTPTYARLSVADHLRMGAWLNPTWDAEIAESRIEQLDLDRRQRAGSLSGGQRAQLALTLAIAKRPELLLLDEPVASLDPLARREFLQSLMEVVAEHGVSVVLSSHLVADLERVCDYLIVLVASQVQVAGDVSDLLGVAPPALRAAPRRRARFRRTRR